MSKYTMTYGETVTVELGQPQDPILVDGEDIGMQYADVSCRVVGAMRAVARKLWGQLYETDEAANAAGYITGEDEIVVWDDVEYAPIVEVES